MGRTFKSVRMGSQEVADRWLKASRALSKSDQAYGRRLAQMAKIHSSEAFYALDDPLEAAVFSVLMELLKETDRKKEETAETAKQHESAKWDETAKRDETAGGAKDEEAVGKVGGPVGWIVEKKDDVDI